MDATHQLNSRLFGSSCRSGYYYSRGSCYRSRSSFSSWGRWVLLGVIVFVALCAFLLCTCFARRRRGKGSKPMYGTGWMAPTGGKWGVNNNNNQQTYGQGYNQGGYNQGYDQSQGYNQGGYNQGYTQNQGYNAPPAYGQQPQQQYDANQGYYGNQQYSGVQQPANAYNRDAPVGDVSAPPGPPPGK